MNLAHVLGPLLEWLWRASWQASVLVGLVLLAQALLRTKLTPRWRSALWWLVLIRLLMPVLPQAPWSLFNYARLDRMPVATARFVSRAIPARAQEGLDARFTRPSCTCSSRARQRGFAFSPRPGSGSAGPRHFGQRTGAIRAALGLAPDAGRALARRGPGVSQPGGLGVWHVCTAFASPVAHPGCDGASVV